MEEFLVPTFDFVCGHFSTVQKKSPEHASFSRKLRERVLLKNSCSIDHQHDKTIADHQPLTTANDKTIADNQPLTTANDKTIADHQPLTTANDKNDKTIADHQPLTTANDKTIADQQPLITANK